MDSVEVQFIHAEPTLKDALKGLGFSGQKIKKYLPAKLLQKSVRARDIFKLPLDLVNNLEINPVYEGSECFILFESEKYLAVHKPPAIHSHPLQYSDKNTVLNSLAAHQKWETLNINKENYDRGLLHRLDFETSGVLLLAKKEELLRSLRDNFNVSMKRKVYLAIVDGEFNQEGFHRQNFASFGAKGEKQVLSNSVDAQVAESEIYFLEKVGTNQSLVMVILKTGIRHQIRAQLSSLGFPILGDTLYGGPEAPRLFLHSWLYEWEITVEDRRAELFSDFLDLDRAFKMASDKLRILERR